MREGERREGRVGKRRDERGRGRTRKVEKQDGIINLVDVATVCGNMCFFGFVFGLSIV